MKNKKFILLSLVVFFALNCGKKGPLRLEPEILPKQIAALSLLQVGDFIKVYWEFPKKLADSKTDTVLTDIKRIEIYYSEKHIGGGKFRKKSTLLSKLRIEDIHKHVEERLERLKYLDKLTSVQRKQTKKLAYFVKIRFKPKDLNNKTHFFAIRYIYKRHKSQLSQVTTIVTQTPINPIENIKITKERKVIKIEWAKPQRDILGNNVENISGYNLYKKITFKNPEESNDQWFGDKFLIINKNRILNEYYEDKNTGYDGKYQYYLTSVISNDIRSNPSTIHSVQVTDSFPPDIPKNLVCLKAPKHLLLSWLRVKDEDLSHYRIYRKIDEKDEFKLIADNITNNRYQDKNLRKRTRYFYTVTAVDSKGNESKFSKIVQELF